MGRPQVEGVARASGYVAVTKVAKAAAVAEDMEGAGIALGSSATRCVGLDIVKVQAALIGGARVINAIDHQVGAGEEAG